MIRHFYEDFFKQTTINPTFIQSTIKTDYNVVDSIMYDPSYGLVVSNDGKLFATERIDDPGTIQFDELDTTGTSMDDVSFTSVTIFEDVDKIRIFTT